MKIVADDKIPYIKGVFEPFAEVVYLPGDRIGPRDLKDADALLTRSITPCNEELLQGSAVRFIGSATIGDDHIDKHYCARAGIAWAVAAGCNAEAVNQYVQAAIVAVAGNLGIDPAGLTLGVVGVGNVGSRVARTARMMGLRVLLNDPPRERIEGPGLFSPLEKIVQESDLVTLHVPLTYGGPDKTFHLVDRAFLEGMGRPAVFINTSRGAVASTGALVHAAREGRLTALVLDVWENEPAPDPELLAMATVATPHIAGYSKEGKAMGSAMTVQAASRFFGLGMDQWRPAVPQEQLLVKVPCKGRSRLDVLAGVFETVCPVATTTRRLKGDPGSFGQMRREYPFRPENGNYTLVLEACDKSVGDLLGGWGFKLKTKN